MGNLTHTVSGDIASFRSAARVPIESLKCHFKPKQDLHGYSKPWPGGGGKNLFNINAPYAMPSDTTSSYTTLRIFTPGTHFVGIANNNYINTKAVTANSITNNTISVTATSGYGYGFALKLTPGETYFLSGETNSYVSFSYYSSTGEFLDKNTTVLNKATTIPQDTDITLITFTSSSGNTNTWTNIQLELGSTATSYEPYENICPIEGWNSCTMYKTGKNLGHIIGYSAISNNSPSDSRSLTNSYGTTLNTIDYALPDTSVIIVQSQAPETESTTNYKNGYVNIIIDNLIFNQNYDISFRITNIKSNPLNISLQTIRLMVPSGNSSTPSEIQGDCLIFKNIKYLQNSSIPNRHHFSIRICGMSFTLSEFMVTPVGMNDGVFEPYCGSTIPITFPVLGKNKFNWNVEQSHASPTSSDLNTLRSFTLNTYVVGMSVNNYYRDNYTNWVLNLSIDNGTISFSSGGASGYGIAFPLKLIPGQTYFLSGTGNGYAGATYYDKDGKVISFQNGRLNNTITIPQNTVITLIGFYANTTNTDYTFNNIQLELGDTATSYEPYNPNNTVYGGYVDIAKGEIVATKLYVHDTWGNFSSTTNNTETIRKDLVISNNCLSKSSGNNITICNKLKYVYNNDDNPHFYLTDANRIRCFMPSITSNDTELTFVCELTIPIHYPLSKTELKTFLDQNNIWSNTNDITEVSYQIHDSNMIQQVKKNIMSENQTHYRKVLWNQMAGPMNSSYWKKYNTNVISLDFIDDYAEVTINQTMSNGFSTSIYTSNEPSVDINHYYYVSYLVCPNFSNGIFSMEFAGGRNGDHFNTIINEWTRVTGCGKGIRTGNGRLYIPNFIPNTYSVGDKAKVKNAIYIDLTAMFGIGNEPTRAEFEKLCAMNNVDLTAYHPIDSGTEQIWCIPDHNKDEYTTVEWNQNAKPISSSNYKAYNTNHIAVTFEDNILISTWLSDGSGYSWSACANYTKRHTVGNYYYLQYEYYTDIDGYINGCVGGQWTPDTKTQINQWIKYTAIVQRTDGGNLDNYAVYVNGFSSTATPQTGSICKARNIMTIDLTTMFGAGNEPTTVAELYDRCLKNNINLDEAQPYNTGTKMIWKV